MRIIAVKAAMAAALLAAAAMTAGCSNTVDGVASCPGCGTDAEPDFPDTTLRPADPETPDHHV